MPQGDSGFLSPANLSIETNLNAYGDDIVYQITKPPVHGQMLKDDIPISRFTQGDLEAESIEYRHNGTSLDFKDTFGFVVTANEVGRVGRAEAKGLVALSIYPESYWEPLVIVRYMVNYTELNLPLLKGHSSLKYDTLIAVPQKPSFGTFIFLFIPFHQCCDTPLNP